MTCREKSYKSAELFPSWFSFLRMTKGNELWENNLINDQNNVLVSLTSNTHLMLNDGWESQTGLSSLDLELWSPLTSCLLLTTRSSSADIKTFDSLFEMSVKRLISMNALNLYNNKQKQQQVWQVFERSQPLLHRIPATHPNETRTWALRRI